MFYKILYRLRVFGLILSYPFRKTYVANLCGHRTKLTGQLCSHGHNHTMSMPLAENGQPEHCLDCIGKMSIKCAWCENTIDIGDPVTLYVQNESFVIPQHAVRYGEDPIRLVGCLGWECAQSGADRQGFWMPPGIVERVPSPIELLLFGEKASEVITNDLSDPNESVKVF